MGAEKGSASGSSKSLNPSTRHSFQFLARCPVEKLGLVLLSTILYFNLISSSSTEASLKLLIMVIS